MVEQKKAFMKCMKDKRNNNNGDIGSDDDADDSLNSEYMAYNVSSLPSYHCIVYLLNVYTIYVYD
jgi:hypothetical protein